MYKTIEENKDLLKFNAEGVDPYEMWTNAKKACLDTVNEYTAKHGEQCIVVSPMLRFIQQGESSLNF